MKHYKDQVLVIESRVAYAEPSAKIFEVTKTPAKGGGPLDRVVVECWPIHTIRQMTQDPNERNMFARTAPGPYDKIRLTIDPELDPILALYYRSPQEGELSRLRTSLEFTRPELSVATDRASTLGDQRDAAYNTIDKMNARIEKFNLMSFWEKLFFIWKGKGV